MTGTELRARAVAQAQDWVGLREDDYSNQIILDVYNGIRPLPRGYKMPHGAPWCAATVSAIQHLTGLGQYGVYECSCSRLIAQAQEKGIWIEDDSHIPQPGTLVIYDWDDNGAGDCTGDPEHVGMVARVSGGYIYVVEGNMGNESVVGVRPLPVNGRFIRGFIALDYDAAAADLTVEPPPIHEDEPQHDAPAPAPADRMAADEVHVVYSLRTAKGWTPWAHDGQTADTHGLPVTGVAIAVDRGTVKYGVHISGGDWLDDVTGCNLSDNDNGYAGSWHDLPIDAIRVYYDTPADVAAAGGYKAAKYRVQPIGGSWYDYQYDTDTGSGQDGYAGTTGGSHLTKFELEVV